MGASEGRLSDEPELSIRESSDEPELSMRESSDEPGFSDNSEASDNSEVL